MEPDPEEAWHKGFIRRRELLNARLGPPGGAKGYGAITGNPPSLAGSVVWWINDMLLPEIFVERGKTYYFRVQVDRAKNLHCHFVFGAISRLLIVYSLPSSSSKYLEYRV